MTIPNSVTSIGGSAFSRVNNIVFYGFFSGTSWGAKSLNGYVDGYLVYRDNSKTELLGCSSAVTGEFIIPNSVTSIGDEAFYGCTGLTSIDIPNSVTKISWEAFFGCTSLISVTIPNSVTSIGNFAFRDCTGLTSVTIPNSVTSIGESAFQYVNNIEYDGTLTGAPWGAKCINGYVDGYLIYRDNSKTELVGCSSTVIGEIIISHSVTSIGNGAFYCCSGLTSVTIPNSVTSIGNAAFYCCSGLTSMTIPNSVTSIGGSAFGGCSGLTSMTIPNSVTSIGGSAFSGCSGLTSITIPNRVTSIEQFTFSQCTSLTSMAIPDSVTSIGMYAFFNCTGLTSLTIPNSVTRIGDEAFYGCTGLTSVTIGNGVTTIGDYAFSGCSGLENIYSYSATPPTVYNNTFEGVEKSECVLHVPSASVELYKTVFGWRDFYYVQTIDVEGVTEPTINDFPSMTQKLLHNGQILILRGDRTYTVTGQELR